jgi:hypothetical protein
MLIRGGIKGNKGPSTPYDKGVRHLNEYKDSVLCHKSGGRWFVSRWCHWNFSLT